MENNGGQSRVYRDDTIKKTVEGVMVEPTVSSPSTANQAQGDDTVKKPTQSVSHSSFLGIIYEETLIYSEVLLILHMQEEDGAAYYVLLTRSTEVADGGRAPPRPSLNSGGSPQTNSSSS